jgi:hypothetical protein
VLKASVQPKFTQKVFAALKKKIASSQEIDTFLAPQTIILQTKTVAKMRKQCSKSERNRYHRINNLRRKN